MQQAMNNFISLKEKALNPTGRAVISEQGIERLDARTMILALLDEGTFTEVNMFARHRCTDFGMEKKGVMGDSVITGYGQIHKRRVFVYAQDFRILGGSLGEAHARKITNIMDMAARAGAPIIGLCDSAGARIQEGTDALAGYGGIFYRNTRYSGVVPQITAIMGICAGGAVYSPAMTDFVFQVDKTGYMFITGPAVIKEVMGQDISMDDLGGAHVHAQVTGNVDFFAESQRACLDGIRKLITFIPQNNRSGVPRVPGRENFCERDEELIKVLPASSRRGFDMHRIIERITDDGEFLEVKAGFARNVIVGFARFAGLTAGIVANQPQVFAGVLDSDSADKAARFVRFCDAFNIPLITLVDIPGYMPGVQEEYKGIIRHGAKLLYAYSEATVPKITVILRKAFGGAYIAMCSKHLGADLVLAWPTAEIAVMGAEGAVKVIFKKEIAAAQDINAFRQEKIKEYESKFANPYEAAFKMHIDDVIDPAETRVRIINALDVFTEKKEQALWKKHGNIPL
ncbi:acyl-CoA carboxylase subunit beta [Desulfotomaculum copahuensis]|uniref:Methylmalonyl-CoA carboxyltransferase n=1 Tax=Desulfotomaculum copahuensis TaxID=1838280 RepID=A0A1B7LEI8_9FIRM|nr:carboxyl transferase domain-containing protein [Desulfotomaculum copahuensis]OAT81682.1 methylmalonyl-CoA carboxyltransferase [Desulfotomaculum copahuensis]